MLIVKPSAELIIQDSNAKGMYQHIEKIGRICYKSEEKITEDSHMKFVENLTKRKHFAMLEHGTVYGIFLVKDSNEKFIQNWENDRYSVVNREEIDGGNGQSVLMAFITTNYRRFTELKISPIEAIENNYGINELFISPTPHDKHVKRYTIKFVCDRGVSHEFVRNRGSKGNAFAQESTRYCNYLNKEHCTYIYPGWLEQATEEQKAQYQSDCAKNEFDYFAALKTGLSPQLARNYLNHWLKTELVITAYPFDWFDFFRLRCAKDAHPEAQECANLAKEALGKVINLPAIF
jgi:thymidylate synthase (FAD)